MKVDELEAQVTQLIDHADRFFAGTVTQEELFELYKICAQDLSRLFQELTAAGRASAQQLGTYQWASTIMAAIMLTLEREPKYGTKVLEHQLKSNFRTIVRRSPHRTAALSEPLPPN
jgi:hypothetical protein